MLSYVIGIGLVLLCIICFVVANKIPNDHSSICTTSAILGCIFGIVGIFWLMITPFNAMSDNVSYNNFVHQKSFYERHVPKSALEDATITKDKINRNDWLYNAQYYKGLFGDWCTLPKEVLNLEPIP
jgi:hypothetical protein